MTDQRKCPLCGYNIELNEENECTKKSQCVSCPIQSGCALLRCPNCGYKLAGESKILKWLDKLLHKEKSG